MLKTDGSGPPRVYGKMLSKEVATVFCKEFDAYQADMICRGLDEGVTRVESKIMQLFDGCQWNKAVTSQFSRGYTLSKKYPEK